jgi:hypothetical protein
MTSAFGHRWISAHGDDFPNTSGRIWAQELAGLGQRAIQRGLDVAKRQEWPPVLAEFKAACVGVLPIATVDAELSRPPAAWSPFSVLVMRQIDSHEWRMSGGQTRWTLLERGHARAREHLFAGGKLPEYTPASQQLTKEDTREAPPPIMVTAAEALAEIRSSLGIRTPADPPVEPEPLTEAGMPPVCVRCDGKRREINPAIARRFPELNGDCAACYGSGEQHAYNRIIHPDGTIEDRLP